MTEDLSTEEKEELYKYIAQSQAAPMPEEKYNVHLFLHRVATSEDTTKIGNLKEEEVGVPKHPIRAFKEFALISEKIIGNDYIADYFKKESEIVTSTSLSKDGFLVRQATVQTKLLGDISKTRRENKGWFKKKDDGKNKETEDN